MQHKYYSHLQRSHIPTSRDCTGRLIGGEGLLGLGVLTSEHPSVFLFDRVSHETPTIAIYCRDISEGVR